MTGCICLQGIIIISQFDQYDYNKRPEDYIISLNKTILSLTV